MTSGEVVLVSKGNGFTDGTNPSMSRNGNVIAFESGNTLVAGDTGLTDVYVRNITAGTVQRASLSSAGVQPNDHASDPATRGTARMSSSSPRPRTSSPVTPTAFGTHSNGARLNQTIRVTLDQFRSTAQRTAVGDVGGDALSAGISMMGATSRS